MGTKLPFNFGPLAMLNTRSTMPNVKMASQTTAGHNLPGWGMVAARFAPRPNRPAATNDPQDAANNCTPKYTNAIGQPMSPRKAKANVIAGLKCAEISPRKYTAATSQREDTADKIKAY